MRLLLTGFRVPRRIDITTSVSGLRFDEAFENSLIVDVEGLKLRIPSVSDLIKNKRATGRTKDLADAEALEQLDGSQTDGPGHS